MNLSSWTHILRRITGTGLSLVGEGLPVEQIRFPGGYERGVVTAVSGGIRKAAESGRFLPCRVTVSRLELWLSYSPEREGHGLSPTRLPLTFFPDSRGTNTLTCGNVHTHPHTQTHLFNPSRKPEVIWTSCVCVCVGCFVQGCFIFVPCSLMFHVPLERSYWWESNCNILWELSKLLPPHLVSISISYQYSVLFSWCTDGFWSGWSRSWTESLLWNRWSGSNCAFVTWHIRSAFLWKHFWPIFWVFCLTIYFHHIS